MKHFLITNPKLVKLSKDIKVYSDKIKGHIKRKDPLKEASLATSASSEEKERIEKSARVIQHFWRGKESKAHPDKIKKYTTRKEPKGPSSTALTPKEEKERIENESARIIQHFWRGRVIRETVVKSPYFSYLSMIDPEDEQLQLSALMFGRHVAEIRLGAKERINNPLINTREYYHRSVHLSSVVTDTLFQDFAILDFNSEKNTYMPIALLKSNPIDEVLTHFRKTGLKLIKKEPYSIAVLVIPHTHPQHDEIKEKIKNMGLVASSWEIVENIKFKKIDLPKPKDGTSNKVKMEPNLPKTKEELLASDIIIKLNRIATSTGQKHPTKMLAKCLQRILNDLPSDFSAQAIQRIAIMLDLTNTFYSFNYPRYALCVYAILHEISLALLKNTSAPFIEREYNEFQSESLHTLSKTLDLDKDAVHNATFIATASTSGVSACAIALRIASKMKIKEDRDLKVKIFKPCYYELPNISSMTNTEDNEEADIFMISTGPIVNPEGLTPGVDINQFVRRHVVKRDKPLTIIIDATTSLYKNIKLDPEVQSLVAEGKLSIIIHESHQKFGLLHSDQAQYGRVFGWCSNDHFKTDELQEIRDNSRDDFYNHIDIRIGAFISTRCKEILEDIKLRHFSNGAILRNILIKTSLVSKHVEKHEDMLTNLDELYFLNDEETEPGSYTSRLERAAFGVIDYRASFGHYAPTTSGVVNQRRLSPDASDDVDALIQACHIRLSLDHSAKSMINMFIEGSRGEEELELEQQILTVGMLHNIISNTQLLPNNFDKVRVIPGPATDNDIKSLINSPENPKYILFIKSANSISLAYCSHDNQFRRVEIKDPQIIAMVRDESISSPLKKQYILNYLQTLQASFFPPQTNFAVIFSAMSNALDSCPLLQGRQYDANIRNWLFTLRDKIIKQYKPEKPQLFLKTLRVLYDLKIPLRDTELCLLSRLPEACKYITTFTIDPDKTSINYLKLFENADFLSIIAKLYDSNEEILAGLIDAPIKYEEAKRSSKIYLNKCYSALCTYYSIEKPSKEDRNHLLHSIKRAEADYSKVLSKDRNAVSKAARYLLKAVTNFIAALTAGIAHTANYLATGSALFFSGTTSNNKLRKLHKELTKDIENPPSTPNSST